MDTNTTREDISNSIHKSKGDYAKSKQEEAVSAAVTDIWNVRRLLETKTRPCRERSLAMTKLDEAVFWIKSIPYDIGEKGSWDDAFQPKQDLPVFGLNDFD